MTLFLEVTALLAIADDGNFLITTLSEDLAGDLGAAHVGRADRGVLAVVGEENFVEDNLAILFHSARELFYIQNRVGSHDVLLPASFDDGYLCHSGHTIVEPSILCNSCIEDLASVEIALTKRIVERELVRLAEREAHMTNIDYPEDDANDMRIHWGVLLGAAGGGLAGAFVIAIGLLIYVWKYVN